MPRVLAYHLIMTAYGFWLPNDPRGSWSTFVGKWELYRQFGPATKTDTRRSVAAVRHDRKRRLAAGELLDFPPVHLTGEEALQVAHGFRQAAAQGGYGIHACAILPDHVHLVVGRQKTRPIPQLIGHLKAQATRQLRAHRDWPADRPVWARSYWNVFLDTRKAVDRSVAYVENNPIREGKPRQTWSFVTPFDPEV